MEIYLIMCLSFTLMYWWNYTREIILTVQGVENKFDEMDYSMNPIIFSILSGIATFVAMPVYAYCILAIPKRKYIKDIATTIVKKQHELANEN